MFEIRTKFFDFIDELYHIFEQFASEWNLEDADVVSNIERSCLDTFPLYLEIL